MKRKNINSKEGVIGYKRGLDSVAIVVHWVMAFVTSISIYIMNSITFFLDRDTFTILRYFACTKSCGSYSKNIMYIVLLGVRSF